MTKVLQLGWRMSALAGFLAATAWAQAPVPTPSCPQTSGDLYTRVRSVELDPQRVYRIRDASIDRPNLHLDLDDGTVAFTKDICGRITGAFFVGDGEIRLRPPNRVERGSLALFTGMAILEEQFSSAYLRFNDNTAAALQPFLSPAPNADEFIQAWGSASQTLAEFDALRLLVDFSHFLPAPNGNEAIPKFPPLLHAHLLGRKLGEFEVFWDTSSAESLSAAQPKMKDGVLFFDMWTSFTANGSAATTPLLADVSISNFRIQATVQPPTRLQATTEAKLRVRSGGERTVLFELSRYLKISALAVDGRPIDFIQNPAIEGSQLHRRGNDIVAVVFRSPLAAGQELKLTFSYAGEVLSEAGSGLLYVGERGTWYPNFGLSPALFDMEFHYPAPWTLVATGKQITHTEEAAATIEVGAEAGTKTVSRWTTERPIPLAGFNLGKYVRAEAKAGSILVEAYATKGVEKTFPKGQTQVIEPPTFSRTRPRLSDPMVVTAPPPSPAHDVQAVADKAAKAIGTFSQWFGPYPYDSLAFTQMPGNLSQGWPELVFLSSFAFLSPQEQSDLHFDPVYRNIDSQVLVHETAHQWWGDLVMCSSYRDQWLSECLADYSSLLMLEQQSPAQFRQVLEKYRRDLLSKNKDGEREGDAGPVTLGPRLESSHFPDGYETVAYERGTWLFHMLRSMFRDSVLHDSMHDSESASRSRRRRANPANPDEPFFHALRKARELYAGKSMTTQQLIHVFEEELPRPLWYEKRPKLDWFLEGWIEGTAIPELEARDVRITEKAGMTTVTGMIVQKDAPDDLVTAIPVYGTTATNAQVFLGEVLADGAETAFRLPAPSGVHKIVLDPKQTILSLVK